MYTLAKIIYYYLPLHKIEIMAEEKKKIGRPNLNTQDYHVKIEGDLAEVLKQQPNKNRYINESLRMRMEKEKLIKKQKK